MIVIGQGRMESEELAGVSQWARSTERHENDGSHCEAPRVHRNKFDNQVECEDADLFVKTCSNASDRKVMATLHPSHANHTRQTGEELLHPFKKKILGHTKAGSPNGDRYLPKQPPPVHSLASAPFDMNPFDKFWSKLSTDVNDSVILIDAPAREESLEELQMQNMMQKNIIADLMRGHHK